MNRMRSFVLLLAGTLATGMAPCTDPADDELSQRDFMARVRWRHDPPPITEYPAIIEAVRRGNTYPPPSDESAPKKEDPVFLVGDFVRYLRPPPRLLREVMRDYDPARDTAFCNSLEPLYEAIEAATPAEARGADHTEYWVKSAVADAQARSCPNEAYELLSRHLAEIVAKAKADRRYASDVRAYDRHLKDPNLPDEIRRRILAAHQLDSPGLVPREIERAIGARDWDAVVAGAESPATPRVKRRFVISRLARESFEHEGAFVAMKKLADASLASGDEAPLRTWVSKAGRRYRSSAKKLLSDVAVRPDVSASTADEAAQLARVYAEVEKAYKGKKTHLEGESLFFLCREAGIVYPTPGGDNEFQRLAREARKARFEGDEQRAEELDDELTRKLGSYSDPDLDR